MSRTAIILLGCLLLTAGRTQSIELKSITVKPHENLWRVTPQYDIKLSEAMIEAIHNGIEVTFVSEMRLIAEKNWWPDQTLVRKVKRFEIHYFSLSSQYQLKQLDESKPASFMTLDSLLEQLSQNINFDLKKQAHATAVEGRFYLDQRALPSTMQLPILFDPQWTLESQPVRQTLLGMDKQ